jgi:DNA polymerase-1
MMPCATCAGTGYLAGARECFRPRPGYVYAQADFPQLELYTLAQCCVTWLGQSKLAEALNAGLDPHLLVGATIVGISYDDAKRALKDSKHLLHVQVKEARGAGKVANFGFPGGLGIDSLIAFAWKAYGVRLTRDLAKKLKEQWYAALPEMPLYFARVNALCANESGRATVETLWTKRIRGQASYCAACNNGFQALGADCAKRAMCLITKAQYVGTPSERYKNAIRQSNAAPYLLSPLFNSRTVAFVHDEFIAEVRDDERAHDAAHELAALMVEGANVYLPDVPILLSKMEPLLMRRWSKKAEPTFDARGRLVPWG